ncbi:MAG: serine/threonine protein kinase [Polyangiaceae bacterium]|nr:serine/threonine protein kinase [Polyangiaceae bacterium]
MSSRRNEEDVELSQARVGTTLCDKWTLTRLIGVGGMAAVYEAEHRLGRKAAVKMLHPEVALDGELKQRFEREALAVSKIKHPGVVPVSDLEVSEDGTPFLVMELLEGTSLSERLGHDGTIEVAEAVRLGVALCDVLEAAHGAGIIHRDIKPANLFLEPDGRLRVLDFGVARWREGPGGLVTAAGTVLGTAAYMAPEQLKGAQVDVRADLFAVGATLFRALTGRHVHVPRDGASSEDRAQIERADRELVTAMLTKPAPRLHTVRPELPEGLCQVVDRALAFQRSRRYPDAATLRKDLEAVGSGGEPPWASARLAAGDEPDDVSGSPVESADTLEAPRVAADSGAASAESGAEAKPEDEVQKASGGTVKMSPDAPPAGKKKVARTEIDAEPTAGSDERAAAGGGTGKSGGASKKARRTALTDERTTVKERGKTDVMAIEGPRSLSDEPTRRRGAAPAGAAGATRVGKTLPAGEAPEGEAAAAAAARAPADEPDVEDVRGRYASGEPDRGSGVGRIVFYLVAIAAAGIAIWWFSRPPEAQPTGATTASRPEGPATSSSAPPAPASTTASAPPPDTASAGAPSASASASVSASASASAVAPTAVPPPGTVPPLVLPSTLPPIPSAWASVLPSGLPTLFPPPKAPSTTAPAPTPPPPTTRPPAK